MRWRSSFLTTVVSFILYALVVINLTFKLAQHIKQKTPPVAHIFQVVIQHCTTDTAATWHCSLNSEVLDM